MFQSALAWKILSGQALEVRLHEGVCDENSGNLLPAKPSPVKTLYSVFSGLDGVKLDIYFSLQELKVLILHYPKTNPKLTSVSLSTLMASTLPYFSSHSPLTSSASSLSQSRSVSLSLDQHSIADRI
jgi:hypothetical protein